MFKNLIKRRGKIIVDPTIPQFKLIKKIADKKDLKLLTVFDSDSDLELVSHHYENNFQIVIINLINSFTFKVNEYMMSV